MIMQDLKKFVIVFSVDSDHIVCCPFWDYCDEPLTFAPDGACPRLMYISWEQDFFFLNGKVSRQLPPQIFFEGFYPEVNSSRVKNLGGIETLVNSVELSNHHMSELITHSDVGYVGFSG
jgi:hypothetical protein